jgi:hypothetical protein
MIVEHLSEIIEKLVEDEKKLTIQQFVESLRDNCSSLASAPQEPSYQQNVVNSLAKLGGAFTRFARDITAYDWERIEEINGSEFFDGLILEKVRTLLSENVMTPTVPHVFLAEYSSRRATFLQQLIGLKTGLLAVGISAYQAVEGKAELGFRLPRSFFGDNLDGLIKRLSTIKRVVNTFSEIKTGGVQEIEVRDISTTDPMFYFGVTVSVAVAVGKAFSWSLDMWKKVEDIRHVRAETAKLKIHSDAELEQMFDSKIKEQIAQSVKNEVVGQFGETPTLRKAELAVALRDALETVLAIVERGVTLELRYTPQEEVDDEHSEETLQDIEAAQSLAIALKFPKPLNLPMLAIPASFEDDQVKPRAKRA